MLGQQSQPSTSSTFTEPTVLAGYSLLASAAAYLLLRSDIKKLGNKISAKGCR